MNSPLSSSEETQRIAALARYNILDSLPEQEYDDITQLAGQFCGTPIALISLVDAERQWFKANQGLPVHQTPRDQSFCAHNLHHPSGPLIVADARLDERFAHNPLVTGQPHIVFYAGVPLVDPQGHTLGSLCVIDEQVRQLTPDQVGALTRLARQVMSLLKLRQTNRALGEAEGNILRQKLDIDFALQAVGLGVWEVDMATNLVTWDDRCRALFGIARENPLPYEQAIQFIHPDDVNRVNQAVQWAFNPASDGLYDQTYRTIGADDGRLRWVRFQGRAYFTGEGTLERFAGVAQEVTGQMEERQQLEESKATLQNAIQVGELGTFSVDIATNLLTCSPRVADWFGFDSLTADAETFINGVGETERDHVRDQLRTTISLGTKGRYKLTHSIVNAKTGHRIIIHAVGRVYFDEHGQPRKMEGIAQDITAQRELQSLLEAQVQQRTQELQLANQDLKRSNNNLQQFAYVASHDLQEPLRKIQSFSNLITQRVAHQGDETVLLYLERISAAGARMSTLMKDLLAYSRISTRQQTFGAVSLSAIVGSVLSLLDWEIQESGTQIQIDALPIVNGDETQLSQLVQNLLTNAIKFTQPGQVPQIQIQYFHRSLQQLPADVHPAKQTPFYHQLSVSDQGIGFNTQFLDRIFQVFQRLHGKNEFPGTGVGLAIVQRVVENHGGGITASSEPGQGATFCVYLPA